MASLPYWFQVIIYWLPLVALLVLAIWVVVKAVNNSEFLENNEDEK